MSGRIDDVDLVVFVIDGTVLGIDRNTPFPLQIIGIHDLGNDLFMFSKHMRLRQKSIDQGRFSGINMGNYGHIYHFFVFHTQLF